MENTAAYYQSIAEAYAQVCDGVRTPRVQNASRQLSRIYGEQYGVSGRRREFDEPGEPRRTEYLKIAPSALKKQKEWDARQRLKKQGKVPTKAGRRLFEDFLKDADKASGKKSKKEMDKKAEQIYLAARALEFDKWVVFVSEMLPKY